MTSFGESKPRPSGLGGASAGASRASESSRTRTDASSRKRTSAGVGDVSDERADLECVWMRAGLLAFKLCDRDFDCEHCALDLALGAARPEAARAPRGRLEFPVDRAYSDAHGWVAELDVEPKAELCAKPRAERSTAAPDGVRSSADRERTRVRVRTGLDAFAVRLVDRVQALVLPAAGTHVRAGEPLGWLLDDREPIPLGAPVDGVVLATNPSVRADPGVVLRDPYGAGWLVELERESCGETAAPSAGVRVRLHDARAARLSAAHELRALRNLTARRARDARTARVGDIARVGRTACDGGRPLRDLRRVLGVRGFQRLLRRSLG